jgi:hypothetical protein
MANLTNSIRVVLRHEGGYNCAYPGSGETYMGIDRGYSAAWQQGWRMIDAFKRSGVIPASCKKSSEKIINNTTLTNLVINWYRQNILKYIPNFDFINNQLLADFLADFIWHKPFRAIPIANSIALSIKPNTVTSNATISPGVIAVMNEQPERFYNLFRQQRLAYYKNPQSINPTWAEKFIKSYDGLINRVAKFPLFVIPKNTFDWLFK